MNPIIQKDYLEQFEQRVMNELLKLCTSTGMLSGALLSSDDIDDQWQKLAPEYMVDAVPQVKDYPTVSVAWACYLGMGVAWGWDTDWALCKEDSYQTYYGTLGFDDMDEHIVRDMLGLPLDGYEAIAIEKLIRRCGETAITLIRRERIEPQSAMAFHVFARVCRVMYRIGAAIELKRLGYKFEKMNPDC